MKKPYEKPSIIKLETGFMNKYGNSPAYSRKVRKDIDGISIEELTEKFGSPLFVFSEKTLRQKYSEAYKAFSRRYHNMVFGWSYKTNYLSAICAVFHDEGSIAEVVSEMEYDKARKLGIPGEKIIFNGPHKTESALKKAVTEGAMINIDHYDELYDLEKIAAETTSGKVKAGMRINVDAGIYPQWTRFGFNLESGQAFDAVKRMSAGSKVILNGLHCHLGTFIMDPASYGILVEKMLQFAYRIEDSFGFKIEYIDIGGGFPSKSKLKGTYLPPDIAISSIDTYAETITDALYKNLRPGDAPRLILESGRALVDEAGFLISTVFASKRLPDGRKAYIADAGINLLFTSNWYKFTIETDRELSGQNEPSVVLGPLCMNIDVIDESTLLPSLSRGTKLIFSPVGAYNITQSMQFIEYRPNVVMISEKGKAEIIRQAEDLSDIERREIIPAHLKKGGSK